MNVKNILNFRNRSDFRNWLMENSTSEKECWISVKRGKTPPTNSLWYLDVEFVIIPEIIETFKSNPVAWQNFKSFPPLYQRVRIDNIQRNKACKEMFDSRLRKLIEASERGEMIGDWHDYGRLLDY